MSSPYPANTGDSLRDHRKRIRALEANAAGGVNGPWIVVGAAGAPPYQNGWDDPGDPAGPLSFRKMADKTIRFRGATTGGEDGTTVFTLPSGYLPVVEERFVTELEPNGFTRVAVRTTGAVDVIQRELV